MRGHIHKRQWNGRGGKPQTLWYAVVDVGHGDDGKRKQKWHGGFKTKREAERVLAEVLQTVEQQTYVAPQRLTLAEFVVSEWLPIMQTQVKVSTWDSYRRNLQKHVLPVLGSRPLQQLTAAHLNALYRSLLEPGGKPGARALAPKTVRNIHIVISKVLSDAMDHGAIGRNVAANARPPKHRASRAGEMQFWTPEELAEFLQSVRDDELYALWHLAAMTGLRRGELLGLRWQDIDMKRKRLAVRQTLISVAYEVQLSTPKSHTARVIDLDAATLDVLVQHRRRQNSEIPSSNPGFEDAVFRKANGGPLHPDVVRTMFDRRVKRSSVHRIRFHDLRHTHATIALRAGVPVKVMSERLGHATPAFTLQQYAHVIPGMQAEAAEAISNLIFRPLPPKTEP